MKSHHKAFAAALAFAAFFATSAGAKCGPNLKTGAIPTLSSLRPLVLRARPRLSPEAQSPAQEPSIAGLWSVQFLAGDLVVDQGFDMWLSDGTEILNDMTAPAAGAVCLGVWTKTTPYTYSLKHPSYIFDASNVNPIGVVVIRETITLDPSGNSYAGTATIDTYDLKGNPLDHETGAIQGVKVSVADDPYQTFGIPGLPAFFNSSH